MSSPANLELVEHVRSVQFTPVRFRESYDMQQVDAFCDQLEASISAGKPIGPMVETARFTLARMREGYEREEVDSFFAEVARLSVSGSPSTVSSTDTSHGPSFPVAATSVIEERPGFMSRLFGRK
jgi:DivIVA domain-containing protein